ncbi:MAG: helix-turn-helix domain-containing protein [Muribaculaceae bacterium]|nr:helix-turn-helix domain-containing protein [Muribaculaceae bacterium]
MDGKTLLPFIEALDVSQAEVAKKLGMSPQGLNNMLTQTKDIKTGFIEKLAKIYNKPISYFFDENETTPTIVEAVDHSIAANNSDISLGDYHSLKKENSMLEKLIDEKDERIKELKERIEELKSK